MSASLPVARDDRGVSAEGAEVDDEDREEKVRRGRGGGWFVPSMRITAGQL